VKIARELAAAPDLQLRMQGIVLLGIFLRVAPFVRARGLSEPQLFEGVEKALRKYFGRRGEQVIASNLAAVKQGYFNLRELDLAHVAAAVA
jgi:pyruvate-ferredoxin/flavodoxin oxidoreductase